MKSKKRKPNPLVYPNLSIRDYFAACAIRETMENFAFVDEPKSVAKRAFEIADAMMKERGKNE